MGIDKLDSAQDGVVWLAERTYVYPENGRNVHLTIRLSEPMRASAGGGFECAVSIADGSDNIERRMVGEDQFNALFVAIVYIGIELGLRIRMPMDQVHWHGGSCSGISFPIGPAFSLSEAIFLKEPL